jgi:hypothetical protein
VARRHRLDGAHERQGRGDGQHDEGERQPDPPFALAPAEPPQAEPEQEGRARPSAMPSTPLCRPSTQARPRAVTNIGTARMRWKRSIHGPASAAADAGAGTKPSSRKGMARPSPSPANTASAAQVGRTRAAPRAKPRNGPVQGVATNAASAPVKKAPRTPPLRARPSPPVIAVSWNRPARFRAIAVTSSNRSRITRGSCSWKAQPITAPPARKASSTPPSAGR